MLFQALDDKAECVGIYQDGQIIFDHIPTNLTHTWDYAPFLKGRPIEYAKIYCAGKSLNEVCPPHLQTRWENICSKLKAFIKSFKTADISLEENCFFDLVPVRFLLEYSYMKDQICQYIFKKFPRPVNYDFSIGINGTAGRYEI